MNFILGNKNTFHNNALFNISGVANTNLKVYPDLFVSVDGGVVWNRVSLLLKKALMMVSWMLCLQTCISFVAFPKVLN